MAPHESNIEAPPFVLSFLGLDLLDLTWDVSGTRAPQPLCRDAVRTVC